MSVVWDAEVEGAEAARRAELTARARAEDAAFDSLSARLGSLMGVVSTAAAALTAELAAVVAEGLWQVGGVRSPEHFVTWQCGVSAREARRLLLVASRRADLPECTELFDAGRLTLDAMATIARYVPAERDHEVAALAPMMLHAQLTKLCRHAPRPQPEPERRVEAGGWSGFDDDGSWRCHARADAEVGGVFEKAMAAARDSLWRRAHPDHDPNSPIGPVSWLDALAHLADTALDGFDPSVRRGGRASDRYQVLAHLDLRQPERFVALHKGPILGDALSRYLTCDAQVSAVVWDGAELVGIHPAVRTVPDKLRAVIEARDGGCRVPGCTSRHVHIHHMVHWEHGGPTVPSNLVGLCPFHHRLHHAGMLRIDGDPTRPDGLAFTNQHGMAITAHPPPAATHPPHAPPPALGLGPPRFEHPLGERMHWRYFEWRDLPPPSSS